MRRGCAGEPPECPARGASLRRRRSRSTSNRWLTFDQERFSASLVALVRLPVDNLPQPADAQDHVRYNEHNRFVQISATRAAAARSPARTARSPRGPLPPRRCRRRSPRGRGRPPARDPSRRPAPPPRSSRDRSSCPRWRSSPRSRFPALRPWPGAPHPWTPPTGGSPGRRAPTERRVLGGLPAGPFPAAPRSARGHR